jgi:hypothetical protein
MSSMFGPAWFLGVPNFRQNAPQGGFPMTNHAKVPWRFLRT